MTTCIFDRRARLLVADTQNTDNGGSIYRAGKIEPLKGGGYFMGAGNCYLIGATKRWAEKGLAERCRPSEYACLFEHGEDYDFTALIVRPDWSVWLVDVEMCPLLLRDDYYAIGSGGAYALGAMDAGMGAMRAVEIAAERDPSTSGPFDMVSM